MSQFSELIGCESDLAQVARVIRVLAESFQLPVVGAYHVTCSDESEWEAAEVFHQLVGKALLPPLKGERRAVFRTMNLGARYERGAVDVAQDHYVLAEAPDATRLIVVKINSHVALHATPGEFHYGRLNRYGIMSNCCGALGALMEGVSLPAIAELERLFHRDGHDRLGTLRDPRLIAPKYRALAAAIVNARLQAAAAVDDVVASQPEKPAVFLLVPCVTVNRNTEPDTEIVIGQYGVDWTGTTAEVKYRGLGDMPADYRISRQRGRLVIEDDQWTKREPA